MKNNKFEIVFIILGIVAILIVSGFNSPLDSIKKNEMFEYSTGKIHAVQYCKDVDHYVVCIADGKIELKIKIPSDFIEDAEMQKELEEIYVGNKVKLKYHAENGELLEWHTIP